jgi:hypothetical protein
MLYARAASDVARRVAPDVLLGVPMETADELGGAPVASSGPTMTVQRRPLSEPATTLEGPPPPGGIPGGSDDDGPADDDKSDSEIQHGSHTNVTRSEESDDDTEPAITDAQLRKLQVMFVQVGVRGSDARHRWLTGFLHRQIDATTELTVTEASAVIDRLELLVNTADDDGRRDL